MELGRVHFQKGLFSCAILPGLVTLVRILKSGCSSVVEYDISGRSVVNSMPLSFSPYCPTIRSWKQWMRSFSWWNHCMDAFDLLLVGAILMVSVYYDFFHVELLEMTVLGRDAWQNFWKTGNKWCERSSVSLSFKLRRERLKGQHRCNTHASLM